jgi:hypothetical protein
MYVYVQVTNLTPSLYLLKYPKMVKYPDVSVLFIRSLEKSGSDSEVPLILVSGIINKLI